MVTKDLATVAPVSTAIDRSTAVDEYRSCISEISWEKEPDGPGEPLNDSRQ
jgi:hypothetical protein